MSQVMFGTSTVSLVEVEGKTLSIFVLVPFVEICFIHDFLFFLLLRAFLLFRILMPVSANIFNDTLEQIKKSSTASIFSTAATSC